IKRKTCLFISLMFIKVHCGSGLLVDMCIVVQGRWFTPSGFEEFGGKKSCKNWKYSIHCRDTTLEKLIQVQHIFLFNLFDHLKSTIQPDVITGKLNSLVTFHTLVRPMSFGQCCHTLHSGIYIGRIRTELCWMTPVKFVTEGSALEDPSWKKDIQCDGKPLSVLIEHDQDNDDDCFICRSQGSLICCDKCPRSFHQRCHLPNVDDFTYISVYVFHCQVRNYTSVIKTPMWLDRVVEKLQQNLYKTVHHFVSDVMFIFTNCATFNRVRLHYCSIQCEDSGLTF
uniref:SP110 nuclear body protein, tandem duplicate 1 n=1 Tax=Salmo trutta TaxID=8032 RepID=A0A673WTP0_SALTR